MKLRDRMRIMIALTFLVIAMLSAAVVVPYQRRETDRGIERGRLHLRLLAEQMDRGLVDLVYGGLWDAVGPRLEAALRASGDVPALALYDATGKLRSVALRGADGPRAYGPPDFAPAGTPPDPLLGEALSRMSAEKAPIRREVRGARGWVVEYYYPLVHAGKVQGYLYLTYSLRPVERQENLVFYGSAALMVGLSLVLVLLTGTFLRRAVVDRLSRLASLMQRAGEGALDVQWRSGGRDEIASIGNSFNAMLGGLRERDFIKSTFGAYVSPQVVKRVLEHGQSVVSGQRRRISVLFSDIRGFTRMSERLPPEDVVKLLNEYMERMTAAITGRGGRIDKFIGDAIMADWGALEDVAGAEVQAAGAAVEMCRALRALNRERQARGQEPLAIGVALHAGEVVAGTVGSQKKLEFTVIGDTVNLASRLEGLCKVYGATIVASDAVYVQVAATYPTRELDHVLVAGKDTPVRIYELLEPDDPRVARIPAYGEALALYRQRRFAEAAERFAAAAEGLDDAVCAFQVERCRRYAATAPPGGDDWDGIERHAKS